MIAARCRRGFTLTEILMAAAILGIGLTMVASVFPVAVDQNRRAHDTTMAALSARSMAALMRARRDRTMAWIRYDSNPSRTNPPLPSPTAYFTEDMNPEFLYTSSGTGPPRCVSPALQAYNPESFLYDASPTGTAPKYARQYGPTALRNPYSQWMLGSYVPVVFSTPMGPNGPYRLTIVVYKSKGDIPPYMIYNKTGPYVPPAWSATDTAGKFTYRGGPGEYVMDVRPAYFTNFTGFPNFRGEAYMIDQVVPGTTPASDKIYLASAPTTTAGTEYAQTAGGNVAITGSTLLIPQWSSLPGALMVFHTIIGD